MRRLLARGGLALALSALALWLLSRMRRRARGSTGAGGRAPAGAAGAAPAEGAGAGAAARMEDETLAGPAPVEADGAEPARLARPAAGSAPEATPEDSDEEPTLENTLALAAGEPRQAAGSGRDLRAVTLRAFAFPALAGLLGAYYAAAAALPGVTLWWEVAIVGLGVIPATFALVGLALPARDSRYLLPAVLLLGGLAAGLEAAELGIAANFVKLAAVAGAGWFFLRFFENVSWVVLIAILIIPVDAYSVAQGPTKQILEERPEIFDRLSISFPVPGSDTAAQLGLPDVLFFALFVGAAERFGLRRGLTWLACTLSFAATLALTVGFDVSGLPALPLLSAAFVVANLDLLIERAVRHRSSRRQPS